MWLRAARSRFVVRSVAVLLAALVGGSALEWGHAGGDDRDFDAVAVIHDHAAHRLSPAQLQSPSSDDHCYICHSLRLLHGALAVRFERVAVGVESTWFDDVDVRAARRAFRLDVPSRAPPAVRL